MATNDIFKGFEEALQDRVDTLLKDKLKDVNKAADERVKEIEGLLSTGVNLNVTTDKKTNTVAGLKHKQIKALITMGAERIPTLMVGMAGTGKTHAAEQVAKALGLNFYSMSVGSQTSKSDIMGYPSANGTYVSTLFRKAYETGGVFLMDEIDAGNANVLIQVNSALANGYCAFPDKMVKRNENFVFIATANTFGNGANRMYVGRNQLDAATLDRFAIIDWEVDETLEAAIVKGYDYGENWHNVIKTVRKYIAETGVRVLITPRATIRGAKLLQAGFGFEDMVASAVLNSVPADKQGVVKELINTHWAGDKPVQA